MKLYEPPSVYILCMVESLKNKALTDIYEEKVKKNMDNFIILEL